MTRCCGAAEAGLQAAGRQRAGGDLVDDPVAGPDADELALLGRGGEGKSHRIP